MDLTSKPLLLQRPQELNANKSGNMRIGSGPDSSKAKSGIAMITVSSTSATDEAATFQRSQQQQQQQCTCSISRNDLASLSFQKKMSLQNLVNEQATEINRLKKELENRDSTIKKLTQPSNWNPALILPCMKFKNSNNPVISAESPENSSSNNNNSFGDFKLNDSGEIQNKNNVNNSTVQPEPPVEKQQVQLHRKSSPPTLQSPRKLNLDLDLLNNTPSASASTTTATATSPATSEPSVSTAATTTSAFSYTWVNYAKKYPSCSPYKIVRTEVVPSLRNGKHMKKLVRSGTGPNYKNYVARIDKEAVGVNGRKSYRVEFMKTKQSLLWGQSSSKYNFVQMPIPKMYVCDEDDIVKDLPQPSFDRRGRITFRFFNFKRYKIST